MVTYPIVLGPEFDHIPDDTEETLVGSSLHQGAIVTAFDGLRICARRRDLPWFIGNQLTLLIRQEGRAAPRRIAPDICVYPSTPVPDPTSLAIAMHGPPTLAIEFASPGTALDNDVNLFDPGGKPQLYARIGVEEYLVFDPTGELLGHPIWAQHRGPEGIIPWLPEDDGRWHSTLGVSFAPQGPLLRVYDHDGRLVPLTTEFDAMLAERDREVAERDRRLAVLEAELRRLRGEPE
jgi:Uma2 family endonuclease